MEKQTVYMVCDWHDGKAEGPAMNIGVEFMGNCRGRILKEGGKLIGNHWSSTFGWLRSDLISKLENPDLYNVVDLIGQEVPERFKLAADDTEQIL